MNGRRELCHCGHDKATHYPDEHVMRDGKRTGANLRSANLSGADLYGADLSGADLSGAYRGQSEAPGWRKTDGGILVREGS